MNRKLTLFAFAFSLLWCMGSGLGWSQTYFNVGSNLPPILLAETGDNALFPLHIGDPIPVGVNFMVTGGTPGFTYAWSPAANFTDATIASPDFMMFDTVTVDTIFVVVTDSRGCIARDFVPVDYTTSVAGGFGLAIDLTLIPNPNAGIFSVQMSGKPSPKGMELVVLDALGRSVYSENLNRFSGFLQKELNLSGLSEGVYFLGLYSGKQQIFRKLMIR